MAIPPRIMGRASHQRRPDSPARKPPSVRAAERSAARLQSTMPIAATAYGTDVTRPFSTMPSLVPNCCSNPETIVGRKKPSA